MIASMVDRHCRVASLVRRFAERCKRYFSLAAHIILCHHAHMDRADIDRITALLEKRGMTKLLLAEAAGLHRNTLNGVDWEKWNPMLETYRSLMEAVERLESALR